MARDPRRVKPRQPAPAKTPDLPTPTPKPPAGTRTPLKSWDEYGANLPRDKARRELVEQGLRNLDNLDDAAREVYVGLLDKFDDGIRFPVATKSTKSVDYYGKVTQKQKGGVIAGGRKLDMHLSRPNEEWESWVKINNAKMKEQRLLTSDGRWTGQYKEGTGDVMAAWKRAVPEPDKWRLATVDEFSDVLVHELTHAADFEAAVGSHTGFGIRGGKFTGSLPREIEDEVWIMRHGGDRNWQHSGIQSDKGIRDAYEYATSERVEMIAELGRFYNRGVPELGLDAVQWREQNPVIANWVEGTFYA